MMLKKESVVFIFVAGLILLSSAVTLRAEEASVAGDQLLESAEALPSVDPNRLSVSESNALDPEDDDKEMVDPDWPENFNVNDVKLVLNFKDALVSDVLDYLSREAGMVIISDTLVSGRVNLVSKKPLNIDEVIALIGSVLKKEGYTAIRTGRVLKIVSLTAAKSSNVPVITAKSPDDIVEGDNIITCIIPIRYADAIRLKEDITPLLSEYAVLSSNEASNSLIVTDTAANIKRLIKIVKSVDTQMSTVADVKVFLLEYADADSTAELINEVFKQQTTSSSGGSQSQNPFMRMMSGRERGDRGRERKQQETGSGAAQNVPVVAAADDRTNAVVVSGPTDVLVIIEQVVKELDSNPNEDHDLFLYKLKYARAENIKDKLNNLFQELENINQQNTRNTGGRGGTTNRGRTNNRNTNSNSVTDEVYIEADEDTNSLIIMTSSKNYKKIQGIIEKLDIPIPQVLIKVLLAELTTTDASDIGFEWSLLNMRSDGDSVTNSFSYSPVPTEGFVSDVISGDLSVTLRALQEVGDLNILSRPYILTSNNQTATINVGQEYPFITDSTRTDNDSVVNTVEYRTIGITLEVTPSINADGLVIMDVKPEITTAAAETVTISQDFDATVFNSRTAESRIAVPHGSTIVIGGLMQDTEVESVEKVPLLGDLPILGGLFKRTIVDKSKTELLVFLTPQVASDIKDLELLSNHEQALSDFINNTGQHKAESDAIKGQIENMESVYQGATEPADSQ
ncbi:MAG: type II secretion system secretin GspD [Planctomycetes bacterium]|nr:type II secretion system secretin GspD [Planctomycetota bacterium]